VRAVSPSVIAVTGFADAARTDYKSRSTSSSHPPPSGNPSTKQNHSITPAPYATVTAPTPFENHQCPSLANAKPTQAWLSHLLSSTENEPYNPPPNTKPISNLPRLRTILTRSTLRTKSPTPNIHTACRRERHTIKTQQPTPHPNVQESQHSNPFTRLPVQDSSLLNQFSNPTCNVIFYSGVSE